MRRPDSPPFSTDPTVAEDWIGRTADRALAFAQSLVRNRAVAEDLVQDCYQRLLAKAKDYDLEEEGPRLLFRAIANACINWSQRRRPTVSLDDLASAGGEGAVAASDANDPSQQAIASELSGAVERALAELPIDQRAAVELHALGHSASDVAEALDTTTTNARVLLHRGRRRLAERLKPFLES